MTYDYIIIGQGICGTFLSWDLIKAGKTVMVIDESSPFTSSKVASGIINPITGRRVVSTWMIDQLLPYAWDAYTEIGGILDATLVQQCNIIDFHPTQQMQDAFNERAAEGMEYLLPMINETEWEKYFHFNYGISMIDGCLLTDIQTLLSRWRQKLEGANSLLNEKFSWDDCVVHEDHVKYKDITAEKIICCEGIEGVDNPYFKMLPYAKNKGEVIIASIPRLPRTNIYKQGVTIVPWKDDLFWIGSNYEWNYTDVNPTATFRKKTEDQLNNWLKLPYTIVDHWAAERPANMERKPFVGLHPLHPSVGLFNGMGSKGCSLVPYFAQQFTEHLMYNAPITPEADIKRFTKILSR